MQSVSAQSEPGAVRAGARGLPNITPEPSPESPLPSRIG